jgi:cobalamin synthase
MRLISQFLKHVVPGVIKPVLVLWNEVIGFVFLVLASYFGFWTYRRAKNFTGDTLGLFVLLGSVTFAVLLAYYGISSFRKARKISRTYQPVPLKTRE